MDSTCPDCHHDAISHRVMDVCVVDDCTCRRNL